VSIIDPELMVSTPSFVTATTGFDVLCHAFESIIHPNCGAYVDLLSREAIQLVSTHLPKVLEHPKDIKSRSAMAWADTLAGISIANAGVTLPHGMGMAIGGMYPHVAHGQALAIVYPACTAFTCELAVEQYAYLSRTLDQNLQKIDDAEAARMAPEVVSKFLTSINLAQKLSDVNMPFSEIEDLAKQSMTLPDYQNNPKIATLDDMLDLVTASY
jgi:alcohol dehydrogenase class IV